MTIDELIARVERLQEASRIARSWTEPSSCLPRQMMPCDHPGCIARAIHYSYIFARTAAHEARELNEILHFDVPEAQPGYRYESGTGKETVHPDGSLTLHLEKPHKENP